jgi:hypothetical protein
MEECGERGIGYGTNVIERKKGYKSNRKRDTGHEQTI